MTTATDVSGCPSYVHSVHPQPSRVDTPKTHDRSAVSESMSTRPPQFAIVVTQDMFTGGRRRVFYTVEMNLGWTGGHSPQSPAAVWRKSVSTQKTAGWTLWTYIEEVAL